MKLVGWKAGFCLVRDEDGDQTGGGSRSLPDLPFEDLFRMCREIGHRIPDRDHLSASWCSVATNRPTIFF
jgi:hypothetical protein